MLYYTRILSPPPSRPGSFLANPAYIKGHPMPLFTVVSYKDGQPDSEPKQVEARNELAAAEKVCGTPLVEGFKLIDLRALVSPIALPNARKLFRLPTQRSNVSRHSA